MLPMRTNTRTNTQQWRNNGSRIHNDGFGRLLMVARAHCDKQKDDAMVFCDKGGEVADDMAMSPAQVLYARLCMAMLVDYI
eukprot:583480-Pyramimonas_sp.AAC.1